MTTKEILSDEESQALREPGSQGDPQGRAPEGQVVDLHADHWERIASDKVPALESISERMTSLLKLTARKFFRQSVEITPRPWREERWGLYSRRLPVPTSLNVLDVRSHNCKGVITLDAGFVFTLVDIFFGGDGKGRRLNALHLENVDEPTIVAALDAAFGRYAKERTEGECFGDFAWRAGLVGAQAA